MTLVLRELERIDSRVLGALRCVDATTGAALDARLRVQLTRSGTPALVRRNRSGLFVITQVDTLAEHAGSFDAPPLAPALGSVALVARIEDPSGRYLPRLADLTLPRDPDPAHAATPGSLFRTLDVPMYPAAVAPLGANWSVLRVTARSTTGNALGGALVLVRNGAVRLARGLTDWRGEALVSVQGVPVTTWSVDPAAVVVSEITVAVDLVFDPATGTQVPQADAAAGRAPAQLPIVNPLTLETDSASLPHDTQSTQIASGRAQSLSFLLALP